MTRALARRSIAPLIALAAFAALPARAADPVFPAGSRIGLVPPPGLSQSENFPGFEDAGKNVAILLITLPAEAYAEIEKTASTTALKKQGVKVEKREPFPLAIGKAFLVFGRQEVEKTRYRKWLLVASTPELTALVNVQVPDSEKAVYPDLAIRAALASLAVRKTIPDKEQLGLLPFKIGDLASFRIGSVVPGRAILLTDAAADAPALGDQPRLITVAAPGGPAQPEERENFARSLFAGVADVTDVRIVGSEPLRIGGQQGHQILAEGKDARTGADVKIVQWLRFGGGGYLQMVGVARTDGWTEAFNRFRTVRDNLTTR